MLIASILTHMLGVFVFLFIFWKRQKDDFSSDLIFKLGFNILIGISVGVTLSIWLFPIYSFWLGFIGGILGLFTALFKFRTKFYEVFEAFVISIMPWLALVFLHDSVIHSSLSSFLGFIGILVLIFVFYYLDSHYKNFNWYKSGKIGFTGLAILGIIFIIRFGLAIFGVSMLSLIGKFEMLVSGLGILVCFLLLFNLARKIE